MIGAVVRLSRVRVARLHVPRRRQAAVDHHLVNPPRQGVEHVAPVRVRRRRPVHRVDRPIVVAVVPQRHVQARQTRFARVLDSVPVRVDPHPVPDRTRRPHRRIRAVRRRHPVVAKVRVQLLLTRRQRHRRRVRRPDPVQVVRRVQVGRRRHRHRVAARHQVREQISAVQPRDRGQRVLVPVPVHVAHQGHRQPRDPVFARVLHPVPVLVQPHVVPDRPTQRHEAEVVGVIERALHHRRRHPGRVVPVQGVVPALVQRADRIAGRRAGVATLTTNVGSPGGIPLKLSSTSTFGNT